MKHIGWTMVVMGRARFERQGRMEVIRGRM